MSDNHKLALFLLGVAGLFLFLLIQGYRAGMFEDAADDDGTPGNVATREDTPGSFWAGVIFYAVAAVVCLVAGAYSWNHDLGAVGHAVITRVGGWLLARATAHGVATLILLPALIILPGLLTLAVTLWSYAWPSVTGRVEYLTYQRTLREGETSQTVSLNQIWTLVLVYTFEVAGREYSGTRIRPLGFNPAGAERALALRVKTGDEIKILYCPAWPRLSCLEPGGVGRAGLVAVVGAVVLYALQSGGLWN